MRKLAIMLALASTALASPAVARDKSFYAGVEGGGMLVEDMTYDYSRLVGPSRVNFTDSIILQSKPGIDVDVIGGYDFGPVRLEAEIGYKRAGVGELSIPQAVSGSTQGIFDAGGRTSVISSMANALLDFGDDDGFGGYVGGGIGIARVKTSFNIPSLAATSGGSLSDRDNALGYQAIAGLRFPIGRNLDIGLKYRLFLTKALSFNDAAANQGQYGTRFKSHSLLASLVFNFAPPPPPPPPPVPAPPPPATQTCPDGSVIPAASACPAPAAVPVGPFIVFFDWDKSDITPEAAAILDNAAAAYQQTGKASVMLAGHADRSGSDDYNVALSQRRADAVKAYLAGRGVPDAGVTSQALGESRPLVQTADGVREPQNRRVEITFGPGSGQ